MPPLHRYPSMYNIDEHLCIVNGFCPFLFLIIYSFIKKRISWHCNQENVFIYFYMKTAVKTIGGEDNVCITSMTMSNKQT